MTKRTTNDTQHDRPLRDVPTEELKAAVAERCSSFESGSARLHAQWCMFNVTHADLNNEKITLDVEAIRHVGQDAHVYVTERNGRILLRLTPDEAHDLRMLLDSAIDAANVFDIVPVPGDAEAGKKFDATWVAPDA